jgi:hypothetical protein
LASIGDSTVWIDSSLFEEKIAATKASNEEIEAMQIQEVNAKFIHAMYIRQLEEDFVIYNEEDWDEIIRLANSCPYIEGTAVYAARSIAAVSGAVDMIDDLELCNSNGYYRTRQNTENNSTKALEVKDITIILAENPVKNQIKLLYQLPNFNTTAVVFDVNGKKLITASINTTQNQTSVDVSSISNGIYFLKLANENGYLDDIKFVIAR